MLGAGPAVFAATALAVPPPDRQTTLSAAVPTYTWEGPVESGANTGFVSQTGEPCTKERETYCDQTLINVDSGDPLHILCATGVPGACGLISNSGLRLTVGVCGVPGQDFDLAIYKSDSAGTVGQQWTYSRRGAGEAERSDIESASGYYLVKVVYKAVTNAKYHAWATLETQDVPCPSPPTNASPPVIDGTPAVGNQLSCRPGAWSGHPAPAFSYAWLRDGIAIAAATSDTYTLVDADAATAIACRVTATNSQRSEQSTSAAVNVPAVAPSGGSAVAEGTAEVGSVLSCVASGFGGAPPPSYTYAWLRDGQAIAGATSDSYTVTEDDAGHTLSCRVTATNSGGSADATSPGRDVPAVAPAGGSAVAEGAAEVGSVLSCVASDFGGAPAPSYTYAWLRDGQPIAGATSDSYTVTDGDAGHTLSCRVTATNSGGSAQATSPGRDVPAVAPAGGSAVAEGAAEVGSVLSCVASGFGGAPAPSYTYAWLRDGQAIAGATSDSYTVTDGDAGHTLSCRVTATNSSGSAEATSPGRSVPARPEPSSNSSPTTAPAPGSTTAAAPGSGRQQGLLPPGGVDQPFARTPALQVAVRPGALQYLRVRGRRTLKFRLVSREPLTRVTASLRRGKRSYARGRLAKLTRSRTLKVRLTRRLRRGAYRLRLVARRADGSTARLSVRLVVR